MTKNEELKDYKKLTEDNGVQKLIIKEGSGIQASLNKEVLIKFKAEYNGQIYDDCRCHFHQHCCHFVRAFLLLPELI